MRFSARLQLFICLMVYASSAHAIMVKFGTKDGPIEPPAPEPLPKPQPYRNPAPVWEERSNDTPDPNAQWRPPLFVPNPRFTQVAFNVPTSPPLPLNNAQRFVNSYIPVRPVQNIQPARGSPAILGSQSLPGIGLRYFYPAAPVQPAAASKNEDAAFNHIDNNEVAGTNVDSANDFQWKYEKEATRRNTRSSLEGTLQVVPVYQWPVYVHPRHR